MNEKVDVAIINYIQSRMEGGEATTVECELLKNVANEIIFGYYPN